MGLIAPWFLLALGVLGVPVYLHLLRQHAANPRPFGSLIFFERRTQSAVRHRRLRHLLLLALRLALLLLLVLAFADPFILHPVVGMRPSRLMLLVIDRSFSMRAGSRLQAAKREALAVMAQRAPEQGVQVVALGSQPQVLSLPDQDDATQRSAVSSMQADDSRADYGELEGLVRQLQQDGHIGIDLHLFSDMQRSALPANFEQWNLPETVRMIPHPVASAALPNWSVLSVTAPSQIWGSDRTGAPPIQAVIAGFATPAADRQVALLIDGMRIATQTLHLPAAGRATVQFPLPAVPYGFSRCEVRIDARDELPEDDGYRFALQRSDPLPVLFVRAETDARSPLYFGTALSAAEHGAFRLQTLTAARAQHLDLSPYAFVVLSNLAELPAGFESQLQRYVRAGGSVLMALGTGAAGHARVPLFDAAMQPQSGSVAMAVTETDASQAWAGGASDWTGVKFLYVPRIEEAGALVIARLNDGRALLMEKPMGDGRVVLMASGLEGLSNDLPLHPTFVAFVSRVARHLSALQQGGGSRLVDSIVELHEAPAGPTNAVATTGVEVIDPDGHRALSLAQAATTPTLRLREAGFYELRRVNGRSQLLAVNIDARESDLSVIPEETLALWRRAGPAQGLPASNSSASTQQPYALWWYIMLLALLFALAQCWLGDRQLRTSPEVS
jgi:hypothetical protein